MQTYFEDELGKLKKRIIKMFELVDSQLEKASGSLLKGDLEVNEKILQNENHIDKLDTKIDKLCQRIFALAQPVATDLRFIMSSLRIGNEIERIGDIALDIIERSESVNQYHTIMSKFDVPDLLSHTIRINKSITEAYTNNNHELAAEMITRSKQAEELCKAMFNDIVALMTEKSDVIVIATDLILIVRDLERIINHLENIAESIIFIAEGKRVKHI
jgi:phosphate transport system protein